MLSPFSFMITMLTASYVQKIFLECSKNNWILKFKKMSWELHNLLEKILVENKGLIRNLKLSTSSYVMIGLQWKIIKCISRKLMNHTWKQLGKKTQCFQRHSQFLIIAKSIFFCLHKSPFGAKINEPEKNDVWWTLWVNSQVAKELRVHLDRRL